MLFPSNYFVIGVAWTLVYEMYFYLIFATTLCFSRPLVSLYGTSAIVLLLYALSNWAPDPALRTFLGNPIAVEFCFGLFLAYLFRERPNFGSAARLLWIPGLVLLVAAPMIAPYASTHFPPSPARVLWGIPAFLIVASFLSLKTNGTSLRRHMVLLGDASYAIYLTHPLVLISYAWLLKGSLTNFPQWPVVPFFVALCAGFGVLIHVFVERKLIKGVRGLFRRLFTSPLRGSPQHLERPEEIEALK
jgi:exopolysaccharide production protein ExoZ